MSKIEVVQFGNQPRLESLAADTWANREPGFMVEGLRTFEEFQLIYAALLSVGPAEYRSRHFAMTMPELPESSPAHIDTGLSGLAMHLNLADPVDVELAVSKSGRYHALNSRRSRRHPWIDASCVEEVKSGTAGVGTVTIFSEGDLPNRTFKPTVHYFNRSREAVGRIAWARATMLGEAQLVGITGFARTPEDVRRVSYAAAEKAFSRLKLSLSQVPANV